MKIDLFSDTNYFSYRHVNQMLADFLLDGKYNVRYFERFVMNYPNIDNIKRRILGNNSRSKTPTNCNVVKVINFVTPFAITDKLNSYVVSKQINSEYECAITFVPSASLSELFKKYKYLFYYCVHDSIFQSYPERHKVYEESLLLKSNAVFCDNLTVAQRFCDVVGQDKIIDLSNLNEESVLLKSSCNSNKIFLVPPPVPKEFFNLKNKKNFEYDYVYFGSIHKDIDKDIFIKIARNELKILCISYDDLGIEHRNITCIDGTTSMEKLTYFINKSEKILLPYKNTEFMNTISPAKIYQSIATGKIVETTNNRLSLEYGLPLVFSKNNDFTINDLYMYSEKNLMNNINAVMRSKISI